MATNQRSNLPRRVVECADRLVRLGALSRNYHGNISVRVQGKEEILMTGASLLDVKPKDLASISLGGKVLKGRVSSSANEIIGMHTVIYKLRPDVGSVIHTHSPHATAYAVAGKPMECFSTPLARLGIVDPIPVARFGPRGSGEALKYIEEALNANPGCKAVLLENHGILTFDATVEEAAQIVFAMEENAEVSILARVIGEPKRIPPEMIRSSSERREEFERRGAVAR